MVIFKIVVGVCISWPLFIAALIFRLTRVLGNTENFKPRALMYYIMRCIKKIPFDGTHLSMNKSDALQNDLIGT